MIEIGEALKFISIDWIKPLAKKLKRIRDERTQELQRISDTFGDPQPLARYYVEPTCQHYNPADHDEDEAPISYVKTPVFTTINTFLNKEVAVRDGRTQMFILADGGMGKTSLLVMLKLTHLLAFWPQGYDCRLLKLGPATLEAVRQHSNKANTMLLLDALDEDPTAWGRFEERLTELLQATMNFRRVLITCRTQFFPETGTDPFGSPGRVTVGGFVCPMLFLSLFDDQQVAEYLRKRFPDPWHHGLTGRENPQRRRAAELLGGMRSLRFRPLLLAHIDGLLEAKEQRWDEYTTYAALIESWLLWEVRKLARQGIQPLPSEEDLWTACTAVAVHLQAQGQRLLDPLELRQLVAALPPVAYIERFDLGGRSLLNRTSGNAYRFSHYSIQEFLVVHALVGGRLDAIKAAGPAAAPPRRVRATAQMLSFLRCVMDRGDVLRLFNRLDLSDIKPDQFRDLRFRGRMNYGRAGPEMVVIPAGEFLMGSPADESERQANEDPQHQVTFSRPFALGCYAVTFDEYDRFCDATGRQKPGDEGWGRGRRPVINVTWEDSVAYCAWLSQATGADYRLPSEAEWEYAARAGTQSAFWWGDDIDTGRANYNGDYT